MEKYSGIHDEKLTRVVSTFCIIAHSVQVVISDWQYSVSWIFECKNWNIQTFKWFSVQIFRYSDQTFKYLDIVLSQSSCWFQIWTNLLQNLILTMHCWAKRRFWGIISQLADDIRDIFSECMLKANVCFVLIFFPLLFGLSDFYTNAAFHSLNNMLHSNF